MRVIAAIFTLILATVAVAAPVCFWGAVIYMGWILVQHLIGAPK